MILFGVPTAIEDLPRKAVAAAIERLLNLGRFTSEWPLKRREAGRS